MGYTFSGQTTNTPSGNTATVTLNVGATPSPWVIVAIQCGEGITGGTLTVGALSATLAVSDTSGDTYLFYVHATGLTGNQSIAFTATGLAFSVVGFALWYDAVETLAIGTTAVDNGTSASLNISVTAGQYMFGLGASAGAVTYTATQTPNSNAITGTSLFGVALDWKISATNASFNVTSGGSFVFLSLATFNVTPFPQFYGQWDPPVGAHAFDVVGY